MAFQKGSQVRPELMRGDMSGFAQAAQFKREEGQMWGQALNNLGEQIGGVIKQKRAKDEQKAKDEAAVNVLVAQGIAPADAKAAVGSGMADTILSMSQQDKKMKAQAQQDAATAAHRASVLGQGQQKINMAQGAADVETQNAAAQKTAIDASTDTGGNVDWKQATSIYTEQGGRDLEGFADAAKAAKGVTKGPDKFTTETIGEFQVLLKNGDYVIGKGTGSDDKTPSSVKSAKATIEAIGNARELYNDGTKEGKEKAKDILQSWKVMDNLGFPADVDKYFGDAENKDPLNLGL
tara:strand:+ start:3223 stop:4101 length:879 start_codon:yes stop_codon:yes gene_type:complete